MLKTIAVENYRSLQDIVINLGQMTVISGPNGSGKSNIYRALGLIHSIIRDGALNTLALEGGLRNVLYAGTRGSKRVALRLGIAVDDINYAIDLGLPQLGPFPLDPEVKSELVWHGESPRPSAILAQRTGQHVSLTDFDGHKTSSPWSPRPEESMLATLTDPFLSPELYSLRESARAWRFYDNLRVDQQAPARQGYPSTYSPTLDPDGANFSAALATVLRLGDEASIQEAISRAFDGASVSVDEDERGIAHVQFHSGLRRALGISELSDGTLRFLMLATILHSPRPPQLLVLNEPESSLHPTLIPALAEMLARSSTSSQVVVVTHSQELSDKLGYFTAKNNTSCSTLSLSGEMPTSTSGSAELEEGTWKWPKARV